MADSPNRPSLNNLPLIDVPSETGKHPIIDLAPIAETLSVGDDGLLAIDESEDHILPLVVPDPVARTGPIPRAVGPTGQGAGGRANRPSGRTGASTRVSQAAPDAGPGQSAIPAGVKPAAVRERAGVPVPPDASQAQPTGSFVPVVPAQARAQQDDDVYEDVVMTGGAAGKGSKLRIVLLLALAAAIAYGIAWVIKENMKDQWDLSIRADSSDQVYEALTPTVSRDPFYMMLIGSDSRNDDENERSDTNIVARVDPTTGTVNIISIPRDTAINYDAYGTVKFNAAYAYDGATGAIRAAEGLLGIKITHFAEIDFGGLVNLVDAMGGVDVDVPMRIEDANAGEEVIEAGPQHLDGAQALVFARSRSYANGDYQRTANQRILVEAMLQKIMGMNDLQLAPIIEELSNYMTSDMGVRQMQDYAILFQDYPEEMKIYSVVMPSDVAYDSEGTSYVVCDTSTLRQVMQVVSQAQDPSYLVTNDSAVYSSAEAEELGMESTPIYVPD